MAAEGSRAGIKSQRSTSASCAHVRRAPQSPKTVPVAGNPVFKPMSLWVDRKELVLGLATVCLRHTDC